MEVMAFIIAYTCILMRAGFCCVQSARPYTCVHMYVLHVLLAVCVYYMSAMKKPPVTYVLSA